MIQILKTFLLLGIITILGVNISTAQEKWRAINITGTAGTELQSDSPFISTDNNKFVGGSVGLHWDFNTKWFLSNWNGIYYSVDQPLSDWYSTQVTIDRRFSKLGNMSTGIGLQYRNDLNGIDTTFIMIRVSKTVRLN